MGDDESSASDGTRAPNVEENARDAAQDAAPGPPEAASKTSANSQWRRLHTLSGGLVLVGFVIVHLLTNASALGGQRTYEVIAGWLFRARLLPVAEVLLV